MTRHPGMASNHQPSVLETDALPIELPGCFLVAGSEFPVCRTAAEYRKITAGVPPALGLHCASPLRVTKRLRSNLIIGTTCRRRFRAGKRMRLMSTAATRFELVTSEDVSALYQAELRAHH